MAKLAAIGSMLPREVTLKDIVFDAPPTVAQFMKDDHFGRLIAGPVGSGKTTGCLFELFRRACEQEQGEDGFRHTRFAIVRQTLKQLKDTVLKDITSWLEGIAEYKVSDNTIYIEFDDVKSEWLLIPLDTPEDQRRLLSMQLTGAWMSEAIEMQVELVAPLSGRLGRYPSGKLGAATWSGIIADTNMPPEGSDWHKFMVQPSSDWGIFIQPGGLEEIAENLPHLNQTSATRLLPEDHPDRISRGRMYYERAARNSNPDWVKRYVHAQFGDDPSGTAVFRDCFKMSFHVVDDMEQPSRAFPLLLGQDFGRDPCTIICQVDHRGRLLVHGECIAEDIGLETHIERQLRPMLMEQWFLGCPVAMVGDPAGRQRSTIYEETTFDVLKRMGFPAFPAPTNDIDTRLRAVESWLLKQSDGKGMVLINRQRCPVLIRGLSGGYRYAKTKQGTRKPLPDKNEFSHVMDAFQYACLVAMGRMSEVVAKHLARRTRFARPQINSAAWT